MEYAAFVKLRVAAPDVPRPYRVPIHSTFGCILFAAPGCAMIVLLLFMASYQTYLYFIIYCGIGIGFYFLQRMGKRREWFEFNEKKINIDDAVLELPQNELSLEESSDAETHIL